MKIIDDTKSKMNEAIEHFKTALQNIRTGRAHPGLVSHVTVEVYGTSMRLHDIANVTIAEARQLRITPYDASNAAAIGKSLEKANLGVQVQVDGNLVRVNIPPMDTRVREDMANLVKRKCEECKVHIRNVRRDSNEETRKQKAAGDIAEDLMHSLEKQIQKLTDDFCKNADQIAEAKTKEIMTV